MVEFRPLSNDDLGLLADWLGRDHVQEWWRDPSAPSKVEAKYGPRIRGEVPTEVFVVSAQKADIGIIQRYRIADDPSWLASLATAGFDATASAGIDYLLGEPTMVGRGVGTEMIRAFTDKVFAELDDVSSIAVAPQAANVASCRVLEKAGYEQRWVGQLDSDDPSDEGDAALYIQTRQAWSAGSTAER